MKIDSYLRQIVSFESVWKTLKTIPLNKLYLKTAAIACSALAFVAVIYKTSRKPSKPGALLIRNAQAAPRQAGNPEQIRAQEQPVRERIKNEKENSSKKVEPANLSENAARFFKGRRFQNPGPIASAILGFRILEIKFFQRFAEQQQPTSNLPDNAGPINAQPLEQKNAAIVSSVQQNEEVADKNREENNQYDSQDNSRNQSNEHDSVFLSDSQSSALDENSSIKVRMQRQNSKTNYQKKPRELLPKVEKDLIESLDVESEDTVFGYLQVEIFPSDKCHASEDESPQKLLNNTPLIKDDAQLDQMFEELYLNYSPKEEKEPIQVNHALFTGGLSSLNDEQGSSVSTSPPLAKEQAIENKELAVQNPRWLSWMGGWFSSFGNMFMNALGAAQAGVEYESLFRDGIDLVPVLVCAREQGAKAIGVAAEFWNSPSAPYDPFTANLMLGFVDQFGPNLHRLLLNSFRLGGPEAAGDLATKINVTGKAGKIVSNKVLALSNPLGMLTLLLNLSDAGLNLNEFLSEGVITSLDDWIEQFVKSKRVGLTEEEYDYFHSSEAVIQKQNVYDELLEQFLSDLKDKGIEEGKTWGAWFGGFINNWYEQHEKQHASAAYKAAKLAYQKESAKQEACLEKQRPDLLKVAHYRVSSSLESFLKNTARKTFLHFAELLDAQIDVSLNENVQPLAKELARHLIFGDQYMGQAEEMKVLHKGVKNGKQAAVKIKKACKDPTGLIVFYMPEEITRRAAELVKPLNQFVGKAVGHVLVGALDEQAIGALNLENLRDSFAGQPLDFEVKKKISQLQFVQEGNYSEALKKILKFAPIDGVLESLVQHAGQEMANRLSMILASSVMNKLKLDSQKYRPEMLFNEVIERTYTQKAAHHASRFVGFIGRKALQVIQTQMNQQQALLEARKEE